MDKKEALNEKPSLKKELALVMKREIKEEEEDAPATKFVKQEDVKQEEVEVKQEEEQYGRKREYDVFKADPVKLERRHELRSKG